MLLILAQEIQPRAGARRPGSCPGISRNRHPTILNNSNGKRRPPPPQPPPFPLISIMEKWRVLLCARIHHCFFVVVFLEGWGGGGGGLISCSVQHCRLILDRLGELGENPRRIYRPHNFQVWVCEARLSNPYMLRPI